MTCSSPAGSVRTSHPLCDIDRSILRTTTHPRPDRESSGRSTTGAPATSPATTPNFSNSSSISGLVAATADRGLVSAPPAIRHRPRSRPKRYSMLPRQVSNTGRVYCSVEESTRTFRGPTPATTGDPHTLVPCCTATRRSPTCLPPSGADTGGMEPLTRVIGACLAGDRDDVAALMANDPALLPSARQQHVDLIARAAELGRVDAIRLLVELGFDVNARQRTTALHEAALRGNMPLIALLVELGADPTIVDTEFNSTPNGWADHGGHPTRRNTLNNSRLRLHPWILSRNSGYSWLTSLIGTSS